MTVAMPLPMVFLALGPGSPNLLDVLSPTPILLLIIASELREQAFKAPATGFYQSSVVANIIHPAGAAKDVSQAIFISTQNRIY